MTLRQLKQETQISNMTYDVVRNYIKIIVNIRLNISRYDFIEKYNCF